MRIIFVVPFLLLTGCAGVAERALTGQTAAAKLRSDLGADLDLRTALQRDLARKNAQVEFVSDGGYSCGPSDLDYRELRRIRTKFTAKQIADRAAAREKYIRTTYGDIDVILAYGEALSAAIKYQTDSQKSFALFQKVVDTYSGFVPTEFAFAPAAIKAAAGFSGVLANYASKAKIISIAIANEEPLKKARANVVAKGISKSLTDLERKAFRDWDVCAHDRLRFLRAYDPQMPPKYLDGSLNAIAVDTAGQTRSPVLDFAAEYTKYLDEREAFIGQRPDYLGDIDAILAANTKIAHLTADASIDDFFNALIEIGGDAATANTDFNTLKTNVGGRI